MAIGRLVDEPEQPRRDQPAMAGRTSKRTEAIAPRSVSLRSITSRTKGSPTRSLAIVSPARHPAAFVAPTRNSLTANGWGVHLVRFCPWVFRLHRFRPAYDSTFGTVQRLARGVSRICYSARA